MAGPTSATRTSSSPWAAIPLRTTRSGSVSSWKRDGTGTQAGLGRSTIQSHGGGRGSLRPDPRRHRHRVSRRADQLRPDPQPVSRRIRPPVHQRAVPGLGAMPSTRSAACSPDGTTRRRRTRTSRAGITSSTSRGSRRIDPTLAHPRSVFQVMKRFYSRYTPDTVSNICGCSADDFVKAADLITSTHTPDRVGDHVCARLDAPQPLGAADSRRGDAAAAARQHRAARRRAQRAPRSPTSRAAPTAAWRITTCPATSPSRRPIRSRWPRSSAR